MFDFAVADGAGACFGVERALALVEEVAAHDSAVFTLGPLIHNPRVVRELEALGVRVATRVEDVPEGSTLILRTHGVAPAVEQAARTRGLTVVDATCPFVKRVHVAARRLADEGLCVVVAGEHGHAEVEATAAQVEGAQVVENATEASAVAAERVGLVCQTTLAAATLAEVAGALSCSRRQTRVENTICAATSERQQAAAELASQVDVMVVLGGKTSANTRHLAEVARAQQTTCHHVEDAHEIEAAWFKEARTVGLTAGASTPKAQIEEAKERLRELGGRQRDA